MVRKIFALASVSALAGIISAVSVTGCSDDESPPGNNPGTPDATPDAKKPPTGNDATVEDSGDESCMVKDAIDPAKFAYKSAFAAQKACTAAEAADLAAYYDGVIKAGANEAISAWKGEVGAACAACVFSDGSGSGWTPIITEADRLGTVNRGGCIEAQGGTAACGAAYHRVHQCVFEACTTNCTTQAEFDACRSGIAKVAAGPCKAAFEKMNADCDTNLGKYETACNAGDWTFDGPIKAQCVDGPKDPGDGGDGGDGG